MPAEDFAPEEEVETLFKKLREAVARRVASGAFREPYWRETRIECADFPHGGIEVRLGIQPLDLMNCDRRPYRPPLDPDHVHDRTRK